MRFAALFRRRRSPAPPRAALPHTRLTLDDWRSAAERVAYVAELLRQPLFLELLGVLANVRVSQRGSLDATTAAFLLGTRAGSDLVITSLLAAGTQTPAPPADIAADYDPENAIAAWEREGVA